MKIKVFTFVFVLFLFVIKYEYSVAQERTFKGKITTFDSIPLINAQIKVKSSKVIVLSDSLGFFMFDCLPNDKIKVSANGFISRNIKLNDETNLLHVNLELKSNRKSKEIAIGYGHVKDSEMLYAVSSLNKNDIDFSMYLNIYELIRGRFPGVHINSSGEIIIRGKNSLTLSNAALIVVDGITVENSMLSTIETANIKSINILKGSSAAIYGSRGANGAVIIETKKGDDRY